MKKFEFNLQPVLNLKEQSEKIEKERLSKIMAEINLQKEKLHNLTKHLNDVLEERKDEISKGTTALKIAESDAYVRKIQQMIEDKRNLIKKLEKDADLVRENLLKISKEKKALENLREKQFTEYQYLLNLEQNKVIDEQISFRVAKSY
ncbi:flagellar export protein FliJ [Thermoanaerobacter siderophilus]|uniref:Flagellar FliJ protein n=1 Tax=Thermoanaerobacter siderophilus SR4 TaxID=880478 RepID=I9KVP4_9THEO|nr:flagellar export protein FliJ [Thermoanaerobacter siderophilus]EIW01104.1 flagellar export protein FliJ [Thermoanaerobacter siderophilus SR4]